MINAKLNGEWERRKKILLEEGQLEGGSSLSTSGPLSGPSSSSSQAAPTDKNIYTGPKFTAYVSVVKKLNEARLKGAKVPTRNSPTNSKDSIANCAPTKFWRAGEALSIIEREDERFEQANLSTFYRLPLGVLVAPNGIKSSSMAKSTLRLLTASTLTARFHASHGTPCSAANRPMSTGSRRSCTFAWSAAPQWTCRKWTWSRELPFGRAFLLVPLWIPPWSVPIACQYEFHLLKSEPNFIAYLKAFIETEDNFLTGSLKAQIQSDYSQRLIVGNQDPYKMTLLKILGRCDLSRKTVPEVITTTQDYIWLQLWLVKDAQDSGRLTTLPPSKNLSSISGETFQPEGKQPCPILWDALDCWSFWGCRRLPLRQSASSTWCHPLRPCPLLPRHGQCHSQSFRLHGMGNSRHTQGTRPGSNYNSLLEFH